jgi:integrase
VTYLRFINARGASARTFDVYESAHRQYLAHLASTGCPDDVRSFTPETIESWTTALQARGLKASSTGTVHRPKRHRPREKYLSRDELLAFLSVKAAATERLAVDLLVDTALRASEVANANTEDVRPDKGPHGERVILSVRVKGGGHRETTLGAEVAGRLLESLKFREAKPTDPLLVTVTGARFTRTSLSDTVIRLAKRAGITRIPVRAHVLRHSVATLASVAGGELSVIAAMLNHTDTQTVQKYIHRSAGVDAARESGRRLLRPEEPGPS